MNIGKVAIKLPCFDNCFEKGQRPHVVVNSKGIGKVIEVSTTEFILALME